MDGRTKEGRGVVVGGDFNARTGKQGGRIEVGEEEEGGGRNIERWEGKWGRKETNKGSRRDGMGNF